MFGKPSNAENASTEPFGVWSWLDMASDTDTTESTDSVHRGPCWHSENDFLLRQWIYENPFSLDLEPIDGQRLQMLANELHAGHLPALAELADDFPNNADSPENRHRLIRYTFFLNQVGPLGRLRGEQLSMLLQLHSQEALLLTMTDRYHQLPKESHDAQLLHSRIRSLRVVLAELALQMEQLVSQDPSRGRFVNLKLMQGTPQTGWLNSLNRILAALLNKIQGLLR